MYDLSDYTTFERMMLMNLLIGNLNYMKIKLNVLFLEINLKKILYNKDIMRKCILFLNTKKKKNIINSRLKLKLEMYSS